MVLQRRWFSEWTAVSNTGASTTEPILMSFSVGFSQILSLKHIKFLDRKQPLLQRRSSLDLFTSQFSWAGLVPARTWGHMALGVCPTQRLKIRRQVTEMLGGRTTASLDISSQVETLNLCMS